jgi:hypothetical protein
MVMSVLDDARPPKFPRKQVPATPVPKTVVPEGDSIKKVHLPGTRHDYFKTSQNKHPYGAFKTNTGKIKMPRSNGKPANAPAYMFERRKKRR